MQESCWNVRPERRLLVALAVSALFHAILAGNVTQGVSSRTLSAVPVTGSAVRARLVPREPQAPITEAAPDETPPRRVTTVTPRRQSADTAALAHAESAPATNDTGFEASDPTYYAARQLDVYPELQSGLEFRLARPTTGGDVGGRVLLLVHISATGAVDAVTVVEAEPAGHYGEDARRAFESAQFRPALKNGRPVKSRILVHVDYGNSGTSSP